MTSESVIECQHLPIMRAGWKSLVMIDFVSWPYITAAHLFSLQRQCGPTARQVYHIMTFYTVHPNPTNDTINISGLGFRCNAVLNEEWGCVWPWSNNIHNFGHQTWSFANIKTTLRTSELLVPTPNNERDREERDHELGKEAPETFLTDWSSPPRPLFLSALLQDESIRILFRHIANTS